MMVRQYTRGIERRESLPTRWATRYKRPPEGRRMIGRSNRAVVVAALLCALLASGLARPAEAQPKTEGEIRWALYVTLTPLWFDSAEVVGQLTPVWGLDAMRDALVKPMPGNP